MTVPFRTSDPPAAAPQCEHGSGSFIRSQRVVFRCVLPALHAGPHDERAVDGDAYHEAVMGKPQSTRPMGYAAGRLSGTTFIAGIVAIASGARGEHGWLPAPAWVALGTIAVIWSIERDLRAGRSS